MSAFEGTMESIWHRVRFIGHVADGFDVFAEHAHTWVEGKADPDAVASELRAAATRLRAALNGYDAPEFYKMAKLHDALEGGEEG